MSVFKEYQRLPTKVRAVQFTDENKDRIYNDLSGNRCADFECGKPKYSRQLTRRPSLKPQHLSYT